MIRRLKRWIAKVAHDIEPAVPTIVQNGTPMVQIFKIANGYLVHRHPNGVNRYDDTPSVTYCPTPMDVARQIVNGEVLHKMGLEDLKSSGVATASFNNTNPSI
jgi:hypothetical protein